MIANITDDPRALMDPNIESKFYFFPVIDSYASNPFLPLDPLEALKTGQFNRVPYITGIVKNEGVLSAQTKELREAMKEPPTIVFGKTSTSSKMQDNSSSWPSSTSLTNLQCES